MNGCCRADAEGLGHDSDCWYLERQGKQKAFKWTEDQLAYDGSSRPQTRELTPRERDILTRIISGWWFKMIDIDAEHRGVEPQYIGAEINLGMYNQTDNLGSLVINSNVILDDPRLGWMRMSVEECQLLLNLREVLTPRED